MDEQDINATAEADGNLTITRADDTLKTDVILMLIPNPDKLEVQSCL